jgi:hypothetical protein
MVELADQVVAVMVVTIRPLDPMELLTRVVVAVELVEILAVQMEMADQVLSSFVIPAHKKVQAAQ